MQRTPFSVIFMFAASMLEIINWLIRFKDSNHNVMQEKKSTASLNVKVYKGGSMGPWCLEFSAFQLKSKTNLVRNHPAIDFCQALSKNVIWFVLINYLKQKIAWDFDSNVI